MGIVSAILLSVVIAFTFGTLIMYISRLIFSFRYTAMFRRFGAFWCGSLLHGDPLLRRLQRTQNPARRKRRDRMDRPAYPALPLFVLGRRQPAALLPATAENQHSATYDPLGHLRSGSGIRRQRPGELHRRPGSRIRRIQHRPSCRRQHDSDGRAERQRSGQFPGADDGRRHHDRHALDLEKGDARHRNRNFAFDAGRERDAVRLVALLAHHRTGRPECKQRDRPHDPQKNPGQDQQPLPVRRHRAQRRPLRHDPRHGEPHDLRHAYFGGHVAQTAAFDHLRLLHGSDGIVARRQGLGTRKRRVSHLGRHDRRGRVVHHGRRRLPRSPWRWGSY